MKKNPFIIWKLIFLICSFFGVFSSSIAQKYDLNTFKFRYQNYKFLNLGFDTRSFSEKQNTKNSIKSSNFSSASFSFSSNINYKRRVSSDKFQIDESFQLSPNFGYSSYNSHSNTIDSASRSLSSQNFIFYDRSKTRYYKGLNFTMLNFGIVSTLALYRSPKSLNNFEHAEFVNFGIGKGRIEDVSDGVTAIFIAKEFLSKNLTSSIDSSQIEILAKGIVETRNKRFLNDTRYQYIDQIAYLDSVCKEIGLKPTDALKFYNILYDNLIFTYYNRQSGKKFTISGGLKNSIEKTNYLIEDLFTKSSTFYIDFNANYIYSKQVNEYIQKSHFLDFSHQRRIYYYKTNDHVIDNFYYNFSFSYSFNYLYQPSTRTIFELKLPLSMSVSKYNDWENIEQFLSIPLSLKGTYFLSRKTNISGGLNLSAYKNKTTTEKDASTYFNFYAGLSHSIF